MKRRRRSPKQPPPQSQTLRLLKGGRHTNKSISTRPSESESDLPASEFLVPVQDSHGHSAPVSARVPPQLKREAQIIVGRRVFPFETESDLVRWCLSYGLQALIKKTKDKQIVSVHSQMATWLEAARHNLEWLKYGRTLAEIKAIIKRLVDEGCIAKARTIVKRIENEIENIDDEYWRAKYTKEILRTYAWLDRQKELKEARDKKRRERSRRRKD
jgi:hypothetical protein